MVGIVVVSHSPGLAEAAVALALEMAPDAPPPLAVAAGTGEGLTGTDAVRVAEAIAEVGARAEGVVVLMDLGSAVLSAEMALEFLPEGLADVRLSAAPFVEGLVAAVVRAAGGASLDEVAAEAAVALSAKSSHLDDPVACAPAPVSLPSLGAPGGARGERAIAGASALVSLSGGSGPGGSGPGGRGPGGRVDAAARVTL
ncbi:MAG: hypothetical protein LBD97_05370, partial [Bifidobacteriaceae bacterium]|nr:hypothetical protein [Bifidobacteriaceae bacterium]